jgi:hypothetical protein
MDDGWGSYEADAVQEDRLLNRGHTCQPLHRVFFLDYLEAQPTCQKNDVYLVLLLIQEICIQG